MMNIDHTPGDFRTGPQDGTRGAWAGIKRWSGNNPRLSRVVWIGLGLLLLAGLIWLIYPKPNNNRNRFAQGPQPVGVAKAVAAPINVTLNALGTVTPTTTATVRPQVGGLLMKIDFTEGQMVKAGDLLAEIDPRPYQAALDQVRGQLARDQATLANAKVDLARYQALAAQNAISNQQLSTQGALVRSSTGVVEADQANVENARINLGYTRIVSPVTGRVGLHLVDIGNIVSAGQANGIVVVTAQAPISVVFTVPEDNVSAIMVRLQSGATLSVEAYDRSQTNLIATGKLATVDNVIDPTTGSVKLRAMFDNDDGKLFPSQFVNVRLLVDTLDDQTVIPVSAVQRGADGAFVFVVTPDKTVSQRSVKLGVQDVDRVAITDGLKPGDTVVVDGADRLRDGAEVEIPDPKQQKIAAPSGAAGDAERAAKRTALVTALNKACVEDLKKYCDGQTIPTTFGRRPGGAGGATRQGGGGQGGGPGAGGPGGGRGGAMRCLAENRESLSADCSKAFSAMRRQGGGGGGRPGGGGFGGAP